MIKDYFREGFDPVSFVFSILIGWMIMESITGWHTLSAIILFFILSTAVIIIIDVTLYQLLERGNLNG